MGEVVKNSRGIRSAAIFKMEVNVGVPDHWSAHNWVISHDRRHPTHVPTSSTRSIVADRKINL